MIEDGYEVAFIAEKTYFEKLWEELRVNRISCGLISTATIVTYYNYWLNLAIPFRFFLYQKRFFFFLTSSALSLIMQA